MAKKKKTTVAKRFKLPDQHLTGRARGIFLAVMTETGNVSEACRVVNVSRNAVYRLKGRDITFSDLWNEAVDTSVDALEIEARRRAIRGYKKPVWYKGKQVGTITEYSDRLLELLLKAHRPDKFRERVEHSTGQSSGEAEQMRELIQAARNDPKLKKLIRDTEDQIRKIESKVITKDGIEVLTFAGNGAGKNGSNGKGKKKTKAKRSGSNGRNGTNGKH